MISSPHEYRFETAQRNIEISRGIHGFYADKLQQLIKRYLYEDAALLADLLGLFAWWIPCGAYCSPKTEEALAEIGANINKADLPFALPPDKNTSKRRVLHVISTTYAIGGHTRAAARMIENTASSCVGSVIITKSTQPLPSWLTDVAERSGGWVRSLETIESVIDRAATLRAVTNTWADLVVLHIHPNDPIPNIAYSTGIDVPVIFFNHADHVFWYGTTIADTVAQFRPSGMQLSETRRGVLRSDYLPIPLEVPPSLKNPSAKAALGINESDVLLLSIASPYKYQSPVGCDFLELHSRILLKHERAKLIVVGPEQTGLWSEFHHKTNGRVFAVGRRNDISTYYTAADIYVDSYPYGSLTSLLDCCMHGKPVIGLYNDFSPILSCDDISLNLTRYTQARSISEYEETLSRLISDINFRHYLGDLQKNKVSNDHSGNGWLRYWRELENTVKFPDKTCDFKDDITYDDLLLSLLRQSSNYMSKFTNDLQYHIRGFSLTTKKHLFIDNILKRHFFLYGRISPKYFINKNTVNLIKRGR